MGKEARVRTTDYKNLRASVCPSPMRLHAFLCSGLVSAHLQPFSMSLHAQAVGQKAHPCLQLLTISRGCWRYAPLSGCFVASWGSTWRERMCVLEGSLPSSWISESCPGGYWWSLCMERTNIISAATRSGSWFPKQRLQGCLSSPNWPIAMKLCSHLWRGNPHVFHWHSQSWLMCQTGTSSNCWVAICSCPLHSASHCRQLSSHSAQKLC